jgi:hypothetical protein
VSEYLRDDRIQGLDKCHDPPRECAGIPHVLQVLHDLNLGDGNRGVGKCHLRYPDSLYIRSLAHHMAESLCLVLIEVETGDRKKCTAWNNQAI